MDIQHKLMRIAHDAGVDVEGVVWLLAQSYSPDEALHKLLDHRG